jgi:hypothetical protein
VCAIPQKIRVTRSFGYFRIWGTAQNAVCIAEHVLINKKAFNSFPYFVRIASKFSSCAKDTPGADLRERREGPCQRYSS